MSAAIRIKTLGGTDIEGAFEDCATVSSRLGGIAVETNFNGVEMFYHEQSKISWTNEYYRRLRESKKGGAK